MAAATPSRADEPRPWYLPDQLKLQLAGNIGFVSPGVGYAWADRRLEADLFFGWVPPAVGGVAVTSLTAKVSWMPWTVPIGPRWAVRVLGVALQLTYTFGDQFFTRLPDRYPENYYDFPTALRAGVAVGGAVVRRNGGTLKEVGVYWELVALDAMLVMWARNTRALGPGDVFSLALGVRVAF